MPEHAQVPEKQAFSDCASRGPALWRADAVDARQLAQDDYQCDVQAEAGQQVMTPAGGIAGAASMLAAVARRNELYDACMKSKGYERAR